MIVNQQKINQLLFLIKKYSIRLFVMLKYSAYTVIDAVAVTQSNTWWGCCLSQLLEWGPFDLVIGGSPCNDLSIVNPARKGLYGRYLPDQVTSETVFISTLEDAQQLSNTIYLKIIYLKQSILSYKIYCLRKSTK